MTASMHKCTIVLSYNYIVHELFFSYKQEAQREWRFPLMFNQFILLKKKIHTSKAAVLKSININESKNKKLFVKANGFLMQQVALDFYVRSL